MTYPDPVRLDFQRHTLDNGLRLVLHHDPRLPLVAVNLWYHVGSKNERPGRTGFAHLFEHLLFQGSENVGTNDHFRLVQEAGGSANGSTWYDRTNYHEVMPAHQLDLALWLEADRMGFFLPAITQEKLDTQRDVVINERRQRVDNQPYGQAFERVQELLYPQDHPYSWPVIGRMEDLEAATLDDVRDFFRTYYVPNNAVLSLAGDFDPATVVDQVERYFGEIPAGAPIRRPDVSMSPPPEDRRDVLEDRVDLTRVYIAFQVPPYGTPEWFAADLLSTVLADGKSSLLYEDLVYERQIAQDVSAYVFPTEAAANFLVTVTGASDTAPEALQAAVAEHLERVASRAPSEAALERARNRLLTVHFHQLQTVERRADLLSLATTFFDDPARATAEVEAYRALRGEDLCEVLRRYSQPRVVVTVVPENGRGSP